MRVEKEKCVGCAKCISVCPVEAIVMAENCAEIIADKCINCQLCISECPFRAISDE